MLDKRFWKVVLITSTFILLLLIFIPAYNQNREKYNPNINPRDFSDTVNNEYFSLEIGKNLTYEGETDEGIERVETYVTPEKRNIMGVDTIVVLDRVWLNDELIEETRDYYAEDRDGNVWYFGEDSKEYKDGKIISTKGSWTSGIDGAMPGIIMKDNPKVGDSYRQEYYKGEAEDTAEVISIDEEVNTKYDEYTGCIKTLDYTPLEPDAKENKYYCEKVRGIVLEVNLETGERTELVRVEYDSKQVS